VRQQDNSASIVAVAGPGGASQLLTARFMPLNRTIMCPEKPRPGGKLPVRLGANTNGKRPFGSLRIQE
ncbi:hypothetical protein LPN01_18300, partial [Sphingomonas sp. A2-49]|uniref:hypothetical protein n=1 Tax=Sphingomonas sp. A2-49 TaxID=1391375 RepID=UPI0021D20EF6